MIVSKQIVSILVYSIYPVSHIHCSDGVFIEHNSFSSVQVPSLIPTTVYFESLLYQNINM